MKNTAQKISASTQRFTEIKHIQDDIVVLTGNNACIILQVTSVNFSLLSKEEQDSKVYAYAALLNSLSFSMQILVRSRQVHILPYLASLEDAAKQTKNAKLAANIMQYKTFVNDLVKMTTVLDKQFYLVIPYSSLEGGLGIPSAGNATDDFFSQAKVSLETKADSLISQLDRLSLKAKVLQKEDLIKLFYDIYNPGSQLPTQTTSTDLLSLILKGDGK